METLCFKPKDLFYAVSFAFNRKILNYVRHQKHSQMRFVTELEESISCTVLFPCPSFYLQQAQTRQGRSSHKVTSPEADMYITSRAALWAAPTVL